MSLKLQICLLIGIIIFSAILIHFLVKKRLNLKYTLIWLLAAFCFLLATLFPGIITKISHLMGIIVPSNFIFVVYGFFVLLIVLSLTGIVSHMNTRIFKLVQNQAIMEKRIRELECKVAKVEQEKVDERNI